MRKTAKIIIASLTLALLAIFVTSCGGSADMPALGGGDKGYYENGSAGMNGGSLTEDKYEVLDAERKIIKTVRESIQTDKYDDFMKALGDEIAALGGYVTSATHSGESYYSSHNLRNSSLTVRIPAEKLDAFTTKMDSIAIVTSYNEYIDDVTASYIDVESRISVLSAEETALLDMLAKADNVSTMLEIRTRLNSVQSDLASLRAQKENYDSRIAYSTVHLNINEVRRAESTNPSFFEEVGGTFSDSLYSIGEGLRDFAVWFLGNIIYIVIFAAFVTGAVVLVIKLKKKKIEKKASKKSENKTSESEEPKSE